AFLTTGSGGLLNTPDTFRLMATASPSRMAIVMTNRVLALMGIFSLLHTSGEFTPHVGRRCRPGAVWVVVRIDTPGPADGGKAAYLACLAETQDVINTLTPCA